MTKEEQRLLAFLKGEGKDIYHRTIFDIWEKKHNRWWLEFTHNYIQWLFPLREASGAAYSIPLTDEMVQEIKNTSIIQKNIRLSFLIMLEFYGFAYNEEENTIDAVMPIKEMKIKWMNPHNHNYLRITRILGCLSIVGYKDLATKWLESLEQVTEGLQYCELSKTYWRDAIT